MNQNYNIDHKLLVYPVFEEGLTTTQHQALLITFSFITHWCRVNRGTCEFKQSGLSKDWRIKPQYFKAARDLLIKYKLIKELKSYSRKGNHGYYYSLGPAYTPLSKKLYPVGAKPIPPGGRVNNINNIIRDDDTIVSPPNKNNDSTGLPTWMGKPNVKPSWEK
tara:strand:+ start:916 stop:1404 length:489 start_codon:yes stop_codon:yes gene_type:complete